MSDEASRDLDLTDDTESMNDTPGGGRGRGGFLAGLALVLALGALALSTYREWRAFSTPEASWAGMAELEGLEAQVRAGRADIDALAGRLDALPTPEPGVSETRVERLEAEIAAVRATQADLRTLNDSLQFAVDTLQARLAAAEGALEGAAATPREPGPGRSPLDEAQEFLRLASERLEIFGDVAGADEMLLLADERLERLDDPRMTPVRRAVAESRADLADVPVPDVPGLERRVAELQAAVPRLPFPDDSPPPAAQAEAGEGWWSRLKASLSGLVTVRRETDASDVPLGLEDRDYVRQGLWLQLETARLALMRRDAGAWSAALERADDSLDKWFASAPPVRAMRDELEALGRVEVAPRLPDIGEARARLEIIAARRPATAPPPETAAEPEAADASAGEEAGTGAAAPAEDDGVRDDAADGEAKAGEVDGA